LNFDAETFVIVRWNVYAVVLQAFHHLFHLPILSKRLGIHFHSFFTFQSFRYLKALTLNFKY